jgi:hypothetical protein
MVPVTLLILSIGVMLANVIHTRSIIIKLIALVGIAAWLLPFWIPFVNAYLGNPAALPLLAADQHEYMSSEASGFGLAEVKAYLKQQPVTQVIGIFSICTGLQWITQQDFPVYCPSINPNGEDIDSLNQLMQDSQKVGVYVVLEKLAYLPANPPGKLVKVIQRPADGLALSIYDLSPSIATCDPEGTTSLVLARTIFATSPYSWKMNTCRTFCSVRVITQNCPPFLFALQCCQAFNSNEMVCSKGGICFTTR